MARRVFTALASRRWRGRRRWRWPNLAQRTVNRALVHGFLTLAVIVTYVLCLLGLGFLLQEDKDAELLIGAAGLVALVAQPLRSFLQRRVDALMYGGREDPYKLIVRLGRRLASPGLPEETLPIVVHTVADALRLPYVAVELESPTGPVVAACTGVSTAETTRLQLTHQAQSVGWLVYSTRRREERLGTADRRLLEDLAHQIGVAARATQLMHELQRSHALLVEARDEERGRLQRDLHDGLGPMLAGMALAAEAARNLVESDPAEVDILLAGLIADNRAATADVRRLIYDLRPPALDRLGLAEALRTHVVRLSGSDHSDSSEHLAVTLVVAPDVTNLPAAVEVAAFRIALEAVVNVRRHAKAHACAIRLTMDGALHVEVVDDGIGFSTDARPGVGIRSMEVRAAEVGGVCVVTCPEGGGTRVHALLPVPARSMVEADAPLALTGTMSRSVGTLGS